MTATKKPFDDPNIVLAIRNLRKYFPVEGGVFLKRKVADIKAVDGVSFDLYKGETLGVVGESGCGKSTLAKAITFLDKPSSGEVWFNDEDLRLKQGAELRAVAKDLTLVFQDPAASLDPRFTVMQSILEPLEIHNLVEESEKYSIVRDLLIRVGLSPHHAYRYPHELSGGQQQRVGIARALTLQPKVIILDEPVSALDVSVQASIINLLVKLQDELGFAYIFIAHDLSVVKKISHRLCVLYLGKVMEIGNIDELYENPMHPYTQALMSAIPVPDPTVKVDRITLKGEVPTPINPPDGCRFCTRCRYVRQLCFLEEPPLIEVGPGHQVACHFAKQIEAGTHVPTEEMGEDK
ncbi:MAG: ATP-binding cassette domain-containing protein [Candidatus Heimdallarchaeota archaeon]|nr:ATP-binding cassette domain-containing protein [Candidatus Heimdallarchaeota archaeon]